MEPLQRFIEGMSRLIGKTIAIDEVGYESLQFEKEEIDDTLFPTNTRTTARTYSDNFSRLYRCRG